MAAIALFVTVSGAAAEVIDRILAVVGGDLITLSDARIAIRFGLVEIPSGTPDPIRTALDQLIERHLQLTEVNRYLPPEPRDADVEQRLAAIRGRFPSDAAFEQALDETGVTLEQLRNRVRENLQIQSYRNQRFAAPLQPNDEDLVRYYRDHQAEFIRNGTLLPFADVREEIRGRLLADRNAAVIHTWIEGLRRRTDVTIVYEQAPSSTPK